MKAILVEGDQLVWGEAETPALNAGQVRIENRATAINRADLAQRAGGYPPPPGASPILGLECAGVVSAIGEGVSRVSPGDEVCALLAGGGHAETVVVPAGQVLPKPKGLTFAEAASLPEVFATAYLNLFMEAKATEGRARRPPCRRKRRRHCRHPDVQGVRQSRFRHGRIRGEDRSLHRLGRKRRLRPTPRQLQASACRMDGRRRSGRDSRSGGRRLSRRQSQEPRPRTAASSSSACSAARLPKRRLA